MNRYLAGLSEEAPALPVILDLTRNCDLADRAVSSCQPPRVCGAESGVGSMECDLLIVLIEAKYRKFVIAILSAPLLVTSSIQPCQWPYGAADLPVLSLYNPKTVCKCGSDIGRAHIF